MSLVLDEHRQYLADTARLDAFDAALRATVQPGDVVLDLASGTGILGLLACQAGASRVYAIEAGGIVALARDLARANGFGDRIVAIHELASRATLPEPVDVIVTDGAGRFGFDAGIIEILSDARTRFLKPGGRVIPRTITLSIAPVDTREPSEHVAFWSQPLRGLSLRSRDGDRSQYRLSAASGAARSPRRGGGDRHLRSGRSSRGRCRRAPGSRSIAPRRCTALAAGSPPIWRPACS